jgi:peptidoglycan-associated lipoprotein
MTHHNTFSLFLSSSAAVAALLLAGCASDVKLDESKGAPVESRNPLAAGGTGAGTGATASGAAQSQVANVDLARSATATAERVVYFDYDSFSVKDDFKPMIESHAKLLAASKAKRVVVEGHTDERGGREYNLALGQKRAEAVSRSLALLGAGENQIEAVSFGKERPAAQGSDEAAWAKNRRAELKDR